MLLEEVGALLEPGYLPMETGYCRLSNGQMFAAALVRLPGSKGKMVDWFFGHYLKDTKTYKTWDPVAHLRFEWDEKWSPGNYLGASHYGEEYLAGRIIKFRVRFDDPGKFFDTSKFKKANVSAVICAEGLFVDGTPHGRVINLVRDTEYGAEIRSRFWTYNGNEEVGKGHMQHSLSEMGYLADILPRIYAREHGGK
jgi:hypothetical protein